MSEPKPIASLSSMLLARKGQAKPAMRPQGFTHLGSNASHAVDDLGWNDMGADPVARPADLPTARGAEVVPITPVTPAVVEPVEAPAIHRQREEIAREMAPSPAPKMIVSLEPRHEQIVEAGERRRDDRTRHAVDMEIERASTLRAARGAKGKAAFTLRLDGDRHLKLRLAGAVAHRSSQAIVIDALDAYLETLPRVAELARDAGRRVTLAHDTSTKDKR